MLVAVWWHSNASSKEKKMQQSFCGIGGGAAVVAIPCGSSKVIRSCRELHRHCHTPPPG